VVYLDDILIYNKTWAEHLQHIQQVLHTLRSTSYTPTWKNAPSAWIGSITWATSLINMVYMWIQPRSKSSMTGQPQQHSLSFRASWALPISTCRFVLGFSHIAWALSQINRGGGKEKFAWGRSQQ
jgi:hypothetical protein